MPPKRKYSDLSGSESPNRKKAAASNKAASGSKTVLRLPIGKKAAAGKKATGRKSHGQDSDWEDDEDDGHGEESEEEEEDSEGEDAKKDSEGEESEGEGDVQLQDIACKNNGFTMVMNHVLQDPVYLRAKNFGKLTSTSAYVKIVEQAHLSPVWYRESVELKATEIAADDEYSGQEGKHFELLLVGYALRRDVLNPSKIKETKAKGGKVIAGKVGAGRAKKNRQKVGTHKNDIRPWDEDQVLLVGTPRLPKKTKETGSEPKTDYYVFINPDPETGICEIYRFGKNHVYWRPFFRKTTNNCTEFEKATREIVRRFAAPPGQIPQSPKEKDAPVQRRNTISGDVPSHIPDASDIPNSQDLPSNTISGSVPCLLPNASNVQNAQGLPSNTISGSVPGLLPNASDVQDAHHLPSNTISAISTNSAKSTTNTQVKACLQRFVGVDFCPADAREMSDYLANFWPQLGVFKSNKLEMLHQSIAESDKVLSVVNLEIFLMHVENQNQRERARDPDLQFDQGQADWLVECAMWFAEAYENGMSKNMLGMETEIPLETIRPASNKVRRKESESEGQGMIKSVSTMFSGWSWGNRSKKG